MTATGYTQPHTLYNRVRAMCPRLICFHPLEFKRALSTKHKRERVRICKLLISMEAEAKLQLDKVIFMDCYHVKLLPVGMGKKPGGSGFGVYCTRDELGQLQHVVELPVAIARNTIHINIIAAVNAQLGPFYIELVSGTRDLAQRLHTGGDWHTYHVSSAGSSQIQALPYSSACILAPGRTCAQRAAMPMPLKL